MNIRTIFILSTVQNYFSLINFTIATIRIITMIQISRQIISVDVISASAPYVVSNIRLFEIDHE